VEEQRLITDAFSIATTIAKKVEEEKTFGGPGKIKVTVLREVRAEATAR